MNQAPRRHLLIALLATTALFAACGKENASVMLRKDFEAAVVGKSADEVLSTVGKPDETVPAPGEDNWFYRGKAKDPITGKVGTAVVIIKQGRATRVEFLG